jgi:hypothetical protein
MQYPNRQPEDAMDRHSIEPEVKTCSQKDLRWVSMTALTAFQKAGT